MLAGRLCFSQCDLVVLPPRRHNRLFSIRSMAIVTVSHRIGGKGTAEERLPGREVRQRDQGESTWLTLLQAKPLINYTLKIIIFLICLRSLVTFPIVLPVFLSALVYLFIYFCVYPPPCLHHMVADQIMSNILPLQVFAICSFQMWDLLKAGVIMGMLYPPLFLSHHISLQLMLQREFHVITLALLSCPHDRGRGRETGEQRKEARKKRRGREKQLKLNGWDAMTGLCCVAMWVLHVS